MNHDYDEFVRVYRTLNWWQRFLILALIRFNLMQNKIKRVAFGFLGVPA